MKKMKEIKQTNKKTKLKATSLTVLSNILKFCVKKVTSPIKLIKILDKGRP